MKKSDLGLSSFLFSFAIFLSSCGGEQPNHLSLTEAFGVLGENYCDETNSVFHSALRDHLTKTEADAGDVYAKAITNTLRDVRTQIANRFGETQSMREDFNRTVQSVFSNQGAPDLKNLQNCRDLLAIQGFVERNSIIRATLRNEIPNRYTTYSGGKTGGPISRPGVFYIFLQEFGQSLDANSHYEFPVKQVDRQVYDFGLKFDLSLERILNKKNKDDAAAEVFATSSPKNVIFQGDQILELVLPSTNPLEKSKDEFKRVGELLNKYGADSFQSLFSNSSTTSLKVKVKRRATGKTETLELNAEERIAEPYVRVEALEGNIVYVKLLEFEKGVAMEIRGKIESAMSEIVEKEFEKEKRSPKEIKSGIKIILDLRFNPGGSGDEMLEIANLFLGQGDVGRFADKHSNFPVKLTRANPPFADQKLLILVNTRSASSSELLTQILQESGRAKVVGEKTFGKFIGQRPYEFGTLISQLGGVLWITNSRFYGVSGKSLQLEGITPDIPVVDPSVEQLKKECRQNHTCRILNMRDYETEYHLDLIDAGYEVGKAENPPTVSMNVEIQAKSVNLSEPVEDFVLESAKAILAP